jgi:hypothetical protein
MAERAAKTIDERFDEVAHAFREQREYTEFCFESLRLEFRQRFDTIDQRFASVDQRFASVYQRFDSMDRRFDSMDRRMTNHELLLTEILNEVKKR